MWEGIHVWESGDVGSALLPVLLDVAVKATVILLLAALATRLLRRSAAATRHVIWVLAASSLVVLPVLTMAVPGWQVLPGWMNPRTVASGQAAVPARPVVSAGPVVPAASSEVPLSAPALGADQVPDDAAVRIAAAEAPADTSSRQVVSPAVWSPRLGMSAIVCLIWLAGIAVVVARMLLGVLSLLILGRAAQPVVDGDWIDALKQTRQDLGIRRQVRLLQSRRRAMPMVWGIVRPRLLVPAEACGWPAERRRVVLLHELAHVKRWDCLWQLLMQAVCAVYWFHPLAWLAQRAMQVDSEQACDDLVLAAGPRASDYAEHILQIASGLRADRLSGAAAIAMARPSRLEGRLLAILDATRSRRGLTRAATTAAMVLVAGVVVPVAMLRAAGPDQPADSQLTSVASQPVAAVRWQTAAASGEQAQPAPPVVEPANAIPAFGDRIDLRVTSADADAQGIAFIDLENGKVIRPTVRVKLRENDHYFVELTPQVKQWIQASGVDLAIHLGAKTWGAMSLQTVGLEDWDGRRWERKVPSDIVEAFAEDARKGMVHGYVPFSFRTSGYEISYGAAFRTREGTMGVLRMEGQNSREAGVRLRGWKVAYVPVKTGAVTEAAPPGKKLFKARAVDSAGEPVVGADVQMMWSTGKPTTFDAGEFVKTDEQGRFGAAVTGQKVLVTIRKTGFREVSQKEVPIADDEQVLRMALDLVLKGTIRDAQTGQFVRNVRVVPGMSWHSERDILWERDEAVPVSDGRYEWKPKFNYPFNVIRVEGDGYQPAQSKVFTNEQGEFTQDFALQPAGMAVGRLVGPDGQPVGGAEVIVATPQRSVSLPAGKSGSGTVSMLTDAEGRFWVSPQGEPFAVFVADARGYAEASQEDLAKTGEVRLQPWARVQGQLVLAGTPQANEPITATANQQVFFRTGEQPAQVSMYFRLEARTDEQGRFAFDRIPPNAVVSIGRVVPVEKDFTSMSTVDHTVQVNLAPGQTQSVNVGGQGRPVIGRLVAEEERPLDINGYLVYGRIMSEPVRRPLPSEVAKLPVDKRIDWSRTVEGRAWIAEAMKMQAYTLQVRPDGTFRVEDVPAGEYQMNIQVLEPNRAPPWGPGKQIASASLAVTVNEQDDLKQPVDLGTVQMLRSQPAASQTASASGAAQSSTDPIPPGAVMLSHVAESSDGKRSLGGTGQAVLFGRPVGAGQVVAVQLYASRYGTLEPPKEDFHIYLLDENRKVIVDVPVPYAAVPRGQMQWYTFRVPPTAVPEQFYVATSFNAEQTKGIYLGLDPNVEESHSFIGLPEDGYGPMAETEPYDWMIRACLVPKGGAQDK